MNAYQLGERFERNLQALFPVEGEVSGWIRGARF
jgi:hypothetical protein